MKLYLASFMQKENFGPGTIYSICRGNKPYGYNVDQIYLHFTPNQEIVDKYYEMKEKKDKTAGEVFSSSYEDQLQKFVDSVLTDAKGDNVSPLELLPFKDGDTLCSWERSQYTNYRKTLATYLEKLGYEVKIN